MNHGNEKRVETFPYFERLRIASSLRVEDGTQHAPEICHFVKRLTWTTSALLIPTLGVPNEPRGDVRHIDRVSECDFPWDCNVAAPTLGMTGNFPHTFAYEIYALQHYNCCGAA